MRFYISLDSDINWSCLVSDAYRWTGCADVLHFYDFCNNAISKTNDGLSSVSRFN